MQGCVDFSEVYCYKSNFLSSTFVLHFHVKRGNWGLSAKNGLANVLI